MNSIRKYVVYFLMFFLLLAFFWLLPLYQLSSFPHQYDFFDRKYFFIISYIYIIEFFLLLSFPILLLGIFRKTRCLKAYIYFVYSWLVFAAFIFPIADSAIMTEAVSTPINVKNLLAVLAIACLITYASFKIDNLVLYSLFSVMLGSIFITSSTALHHFFVENQYDKIRKDFSNLSNKKNIIVVSFDGLSNNIAHKILVTDDRLRRKFTDFTFYRNAVSPAPTTHPSIRSELYGNHNFRFHDKKIDINIDKLLDLDKLPINKIENSFTYGPYSLYKNDERKLAPGIYYKKKSMLYVYANYKYWFELNLARVLGGKGLSIIENLGLLKLPHKIISLSSNSFDLVVSQFSGAQWDLPNVLQVYDFQGIVADLHANHDNLSIRMMHFNHTHFPVDFDESCTIRSVDGDWHNANQNYSGLSNQTICAFKLFYLFLEKLKEIGIYDQTLIVLKGDHGEHAYFFNEYPYNLKINDHPVVGIDRYSPLLMIKGFNQTHSDMKIDNRLVSLADLSPTICLSIKDYLPSGSCNNFTGVNLLSSQSDNIENYPLYLDIYYKNDSQQFDLPITQELRRRQGKTLFDVMIDSDFLDLSP